MSVTDNQNPEDQNPEDRHFVDFESDSIDKAMLKRLRKDLQEAAKLLDLFEVRQLVRSYYGRQEDRKRTGNRICAMEKEGRKPTLVLSTLFDADERMEKMLVSALGIFATEYRVGRWLQSIRGIGPVLSAGLLSMLDIRGRPTAGHFQRFAGYDPNARWVSAKNSDKFVEQMLTYADKGRGGKPICDESTVLRVSESLRRRYDNLLHMVRYYGDGKITVKALVKAVARRPYNPNLKVLCWKAVDCIIKGKGYPDSFYGKLYEQQKLREIEKNERGGNRQYAVDAIRKGVVKKTHEHFETYSAGKLIPAHVDARTRRWVAKMLLSHLHHVMWEDYYGYEPPVPYMFSKAPGDHRDYIPPPKWPGEHQGKNLQALLLPREGDKYLQGKTGPQPKYSHMDKSDLPDWYDPFEEMDLSGEDWFQNADEMLRGFDNRDSEAA